MGHAEVVVEAGADGAEVEAKRAQMMVRFGAHPHGVLSRRTTPIRRSSNVSRTERHLKWFLHLTVCSSRTPLTTLHILPSPSSQDKLNAIESARQLEVEARRSLATEAADPRENVRWFLKTFDDDRLGVETALAEERDKHAAANGDSNVETQETQKATLETLRVTTLQMEKRIAEASYFLPPYDARFCTSSVEKLKLDLGEAAAQMAPRKKFSFKSKKKQEKEKAGDTGDTTVGSTAGDMTVGDSGKVSGDANPEKETSSIPADLLAKVAALASAADANGYTDAVGKVFIFRNQEGSNQAGLPDLVLERLTDCVVFILGSVRAMRCHDLENCRVYGGPVSGSTHAQRLKNCHVEVCSRQVRIHDAFDTTFHIRTTSRPIIEHSTGVSFAPYGFEWHGQDDELKKAQLFDETNAWREVDDFGWIKKQHSPNWCVVPEVDRALPPEAPEPETKSD
jgi:hypothetical protein